MRFQLPDGQTVLLDREFVFNGVQYPANWLRLMSVAEREAFGAVEVPEPPAPPPPPPPIPTVVTPLQARVALAHFGLLTSVEAAVQASTDPVVKIAWEYATEFRRESVLLQSLAATLPITNEQLDAIFTYAAGVTV